MLQRIDRICAPHEQGSTPTASGSAEEWSDCCPRCTGRGVWRDEAFHRGLWVLAECTRCGERWTHGPATAGLGVQRRPTDQWDRGKSLPDLAA